MRCHDANPGVSDSRSTCEVATNIKAVMIAAIGA
jgi:hypothetical protein